MYTKHLISITFYVVPESKLLVNRREETMPRLSDNNTQTCVDMAEYGGCSLNQVVIYSLKCH